MSNEAPTDVRRFLVETGSICQYCRMPTGNFCTPPDGTPCVGPVKSNSICAWCEWKRAICRNCKSNGVSDIRWCDTCHTRRSVRSCLTCTQRFYCSDACLMEDATRGQHQQRCVQDKIRVSRAHHRWEEEQRTSQG